MSSNSFSITRFESANKNREIPNRFDGLRQMPFKYTIPDRTQQKIPWRQRLHGEKPSVTQTPEQLLPAALLRFLSSYVFHAGARNRRDNCHSRRAKDRSEVAIAH